MNKLPVPFTNWSTYPNHSGMDFGQPAGAIVRASGRFKVVKRGWINNRAGYGVQVRYLDNNGLEVLYCHFNNLNHVPAVGHVGGFYDAIGTVGSTGNSTGPHLHMEIMVGKETHTFAAVNRYFDTANVISQKPPTYTVSDAGGAVPGVHGPNPFGIPFTGGLQKIARLYGYKGALDQVFGEGSMAGFAEFLRRNWGYVGNNILGPVMWKAIQRWLKARYGYTGGIDGIPGPLTRAALSRADTKNWAEL